MIVLLKRDVVSFPLSAIVGFFCIAVLCVCVCKGNTTHSFDYYFICFCEMKCIICFWTLKFFVLLTHMQVFGQILSLLSSNTVKQKYFIIKYTNIFLLILLFNVTAFILNINHLCGIVHGSMHTVFFALSITFVSTIFVLKPENLNIKYNCPYFSKLF